MNPARIAGAWAALLAIALAAGCVTRGSLGAVEAHQAMSMASRALGGSRDLMLVIIPSRGPAEDAAYMEQARTNGPTAMALQVADYFSAAVIAPRAYAVVGLNSEKTAQVVCDALAMNRGRNLAKLQVVYLGSPAHGRAIEDAARASGACVVILEYPPPPGAL